MGLKDQLAEILPADILPYVSDHFEVIGDIAVHQLTHTGRMESRIAKYDNEKIDRIREKIKVVFGKESTMDDLALSERYNITSNGDLIMILR